MKVRYSLWTERPRHVSQHEYDQYLLWVAGYVVTGGLAIASFTLASLNVSAWVTRELALIPAMTVAEVANYTGDREDLIKVEGFLVTDTPLTMPDDDQAQVIQGSLKIEVEGDRQNERIATTLLDWQAAAPRVFLTDGTYQVPLGFDPRSLPLPETTTEFAAIERVGPARTSTPVQVEYRALTFPLDPALWSEADAVSVDITRRVLPQGAAVVIVAGISTQPNGGGQLIDPLGERLQVHLGTEAELAQRGVQNRWALGLMSLPLAIASGLLYQRAHQVYQHFATVSNQP